MEAWQWRMDGSESRWFRWLFKNSITRKTTDNHIVGWVYKNKGIKIKEQNLKWSQRLCICVLCSNFNKVQMFSCPSWAILTSSSTQIFSNSIFNFFLLAKMRICQEILFFPKEGSTGPPQAVTFKEFDVRSSSQRRWNEKKTGTKTAHTFKNIKHWQTYRIRIILYKSMIKHWLETKAWTIHLKLYSWNVVWWTLKNYCKLKNKYFVNIK